MLRPLQESFPGEEAEVTPPALAEQVVEPHRSHNLDFLGAAGLHELAIPAAIKIRMWLRFKYSPNKKATKTCSSRSCFSGQQNPGQISALTSLSQSNIRDSGKKNFQPL
jgi:hypothetical protein